VYDAVSTRLLEVYPLADRIVSVESYRPGYASYPARATLLLQGGSLTTVVVKADARADPISREAKVLRALAGLGVPVPTVLAGPLESDSGDAPLTIVVLSELPGEPLPWIGLNDLSRAYRTCRLLGQAVDQMHSLTPAIRRLEIGSELPNTTLQSELDAIVARGGPWLDHPLFREALALLEGEIPLEQSALVFSSGDYNPLNFVVLDDAISGWLDFAAACFEDPLVGFAKFLLWADDGLGWGAGAKAGLVERYLYEHDVEPRTFLLRLVLRGLTHVQHVPADGSARHMIEVIREAVGRLGATRRV
jgi:aminoglycoside phosphotransferase